MANTCYCAVVMKDRKSFNEVLDYVESSDKFKNFMVDKDIDYMGGAVWWRRYILRFETKWEPNHWIARHIAKICPDFEFWWQETGCGIAGRSIYQNGKSGGTKSIECEITDPEMIDCLYYTDWGGVSWEETLNDNTGFIVTSNLRFPYDFKVEVEQFVGEYGTEDYKHLILETNYCSLFNFKKLVDTIREKYSA